MDGFAISCPLCSQVFDADAQYAAHLADQHGLVDDEGTETTLAQAAVSSGGWATVVAVESEAPVAPTPPASSRGLVVDLASVDPSRLFDPRADDARWRVLVIGLTGVAILALVLAFGALRR